MDDHQPTLTRPFILFSLATFLSFLGTSSISYFSVMLADMGFSSEEIGWVLSAALVPVVLGILLCGELLTRFTALQLAVVGQIVTLLAYGSFLLTINDPMLAAVSRFMVGAGFGLFFPAAFIYARSLVSGPRSVFLFGIYSTMIPLPNLVGPGLAELIYGGVGTEAVLWSFTACITAGVVISLILPAMEQAKGRPEPVRFRTILARPETFLPNLSICVVGLLWGFMLSFMALYLHNSGVSPTIFFSTATAAMVVSRFTIMAWLGQKPREYVSAAGLAFMAIGYLILPVLVESFQSVFVSALIFGLGYSFAFPVLSLWATDLYPLAQRGRPMAVFTGYFQGAIFAIPFLTGYFSDNDFSSALVLLASIAGIMAVFLLISGLLGRRSA